MPADQPFARGFLSELAPADREALLSRLRQATFEDGQDMVSAGDAGGDVFFLLEGKAEVALYSPHGRLVLYRDMAAGDIFGELAAIDGGARSAFVVAKGRARAGVLSARAFEQAMAEHPGVALAVMRHLARTVRRLTERVFEHTALNVRHRLLCELLRRARQAAGPGAQSARLSPPPKHADLAAHIGTHREAVTKELSALTREGLLGKERGVLAIPSLRRVEEEIGL